jgi:hypothetical protein
MRLLLALAPLVLVAACGDVPVYVGDRLISGGPRTAEAAVPATPGAVPGTTPAVAPADEGLTLFGQPVYIGNRRVGAPGGAAGGAPAFNIPVYIGDTQIAGPGLDRAAP